MGFVPTWLLWMVIVAAAAIGPFVSMLLLFFAGELLWDAADAIGPPAALSLCLGVLLGLMLGRTRARPPQHSAT